MTWPAASPTAIKPSATVLAGGPSGRPPMVRATADPIILFLIKSFCRKARKRSQPLSRVQRPILARSSPQGMTQAKRPGASPRCTSTFSGSSTAKGASTCAPERIICEGPMPAWRANLALTPSADITTFARISSPSARARTHPPSSRLTLRTDERSLSSAPSRRASRDSARSKCLLSTTHALQDSALKSRRNPPGE